MASVSMKGVSPKLGIMDEGFNFLICYPWAESVWGDSTFSHSNLQLTAREWTVDQVCDWLCGLGQNFVQYTISFRENGVNGRCLLEDLDDVTINDLIYTNLHKKRILNEIAILKSKNQQRQRSMYQTVMKGLIAVPAQYLALLDLLPTPNDGAKKIPIKALVALFLASNQARATSTSCRRNQLMLRVIDYTRHSLGTRSIEPCTAALLCGLFLENKALDIYYRRKKYGLEVPDILGAFVDFVGQRYCGVPLHRSTGWAPLSGFIPAIMRREIRRLKKVLHVIMIHIIHENPEETGAKEISNFGGKLQFQPKLLKFTFVFEHVKFDS